MNFEVGKTGDGGVEFRSRARRVAYVSHLAVQGPPPEKMAEGYTLVPYAGTESEEDLPSKVQASNSFLVNLEA